MNWKQTVPIIAALALRCTAADSSIGYNRDIRPLFSNTCFKCHGPDVKNNKSDVRLDQSEIAYAPHRDKNGQVTTPVVPGHPELSEMWRRISSEDPSIAMPPRDDPRQLSAQDKELIKRWIEQGAKYEPHWAYIAPVKAQPPAPQPRERNEIDRFVFGALTAHGVAPAPEAEPRTLIRRVTLDLTGLPPTPQEVASYLADQSPDAYGHLVDRLLASPHYGERMAVPWLDLARFADTVGYHGDQIENDFPYRDYVIDAFNRNERFDQFTLEQIAGDLLPNATPEQRVASGFNRLNMVTREGGAQPREYLAKYAADRVRTVSTVWLGSTMACCECHDHKFDPFKTRDFYSLEAYFSDLKEFGVYANYPSALAPELTGWTNDDPFPPEIQVKSRYLEERRDHFARRLEVRAAQAAHSLLATPQGQKALETWIASVAPRIKVEESGWQAATATKADGLGAKIEADGTVLLTKSVNTKPGGNDDNPEIDKLIGKRSERALDGGAITMEFDAPAGPCASLRIEVLPDPEHKGRVTVDEKSDRFVMAIKGVAVRQAGRDIPQPLELPCGYADRDTDSYMNGEIQASLMRGWTSRGRYVREGQSGIFLLSHPTTFAAGDKIIATLACVEVGRIRLSVSPLGLRMPGDSLPADEKSAFAVAARTSHQETLLAGEYFRGTGEPQSAGYADALSDFQEMANCRDGMAYSVVSFSVPRRVIRILPRGDWQNQSGDVVQPSPPGFLLGGSAVPGPSRLDLARWLTSRSNPLTARVFVNRLWAQFFGSGIAATVDDLGTRGDYPSNPELLDWLAVEFMDRGWNIKAMVKEIVTSETYRQSSRIRPDLEETDPLNRWVGRQEPRRLDAEFVRDNALFAAGLLNLDLGGPSVYPYQPEGYYTALVFPQRKYVADTDDREYRRGLYMHWQRTFLHPMLANFDAPSREECTAARTISSTPQQALTLLNDPTFMEAARVLAERTIRDCKHDDFAARLDDAFDRLLARRPRPAEQASLASYYQEQLSYYRANPKEAQKLLTIGLHPISSGIDKVELASLTAVTRVLLNLNETIVRY